MQFFVSTCYTVKWVFSQFACLLVLVNTSFSQPVEKNALRLGTASPSGSYFKVGREIEQICERNIDKLSITVSNTGGSVDNLVKLKNGVLDLAIIQNDIGYMAENGMTAGIESLQPFADGLSGLGVIATFYPEPIYVISSRLDYARVSQLENHRISIGNEGSGDVYQCQEYSR